MYKIAKQSYESLHNLNPCLLLPNKSFQICFTKVRSDTNLQEEKKKNLCNIIYSNEAFNKNCTQEGNSSEVKKHNLQNTIQPMEQSETTTSKRNNRSTLKRLSVGLMSRNDSNIHKKSKMIKRMTRSGKIYSRFE